MRSGEGMTKRMPQRAIAGWLMFDWAAQPWFTLITTFVFAPWFASKVAQTPAEGQAMWGYASGFAGLCIALLGPSLGSIADQMGQRKPWIAAFSFIYVICASLLWFTDPGSSHAVIIALTAFCIGTIAIECATVFNNAMMPSLLPRHSWGRLSGYGWATGYVGGLVSLVVVLGFLAANPQTGLTMLGQIPLMGLEPELSEGDRISGPFSAIWYIIFVLPLFLFTPDGNKQAPLKQARRHVWRRILQSIKDAREEQHLFRFLIANMIYKDGLAALFVFGGIYATVTFDWEIMEMGIFGILLTLTGTIGAIIGGIFDDKKGPKPVVIVSLVFLIICSVGMLSLEKDRVFFLYSVDPTWTGLFSTLPEQIFLGFAGIIGFCSGPLQSASRTLLARLSPPQKRTEFFGLFALSGKLTSFAGPVAVATITTVTGDVRLGVAVLVLFLGVGLILLTRVRQPDVG